MIAVDTRYRAWALGEPVNPNYNEPVGTSGSVCVALRRNIKSDDSDSLSVKGWVAVSCATELPVICKKPAIHDDEEHHRNGQHTQQVRYNNARRLEDGVPEKRGVAASTDQTRATIRTTTTTVPLCPQGWTWLQISAPDEPCAGRCYLFVPTLGSSSRQENFCSLRGGHLAAARGAIEHAAISYVVTTNYPALFEPARSSSTSHDASHSADPPLTWLGFLYAFPTEKGVPIERDFGWIRYDASVLFDAAFEKWAPQQPTAPSDAPPGSFLCVALDASSSSDGHVYPQWVVRLCREKHYAVCERPAALVDEAKCVRRTIVATEAEADSTSLMNSADDKWAKGGEASTVPMERLRGGKRITPATKRRLAANDSSSNAHLPAFERQTKTPQRRVGCAPGWSFFNQSAHRSSKRSVCFKILHTPKAHLAASDACRQSMDDSHRESAAHLAAITSSAESSFIRSLLTPGRDTWIGLFYAFEVRSDPRISLDAEFGWLWRGRRVRSPYTNWASNVRLFPFPSFTPPLCTLPRARSRTSFHHNDVFPYRCIYTNTGTSQPVAY